MPQDGARVLLVGAGHAHLEVLRRHARGDRGGASITLVDPSPRWTYSGMLPGVIAGHYRLEEAQVDVAALARRAGAASIVGEVAALDPHARCARLASGEVLAFDLASLDVGSIPAPLAGRHADAIAVKPFSLLLARFADWRERHVRGELGTLAVVGGGAGAIELALAMHHALTRLRPGPRIVVVADAINLASAAAARARRVFARRTIALEIGAAVAGLDDRALVLASGRRLAAEHVVLATGASAPSWLRASGLACDDAGFVAVRPTLCSVSHDHVLASGDCASIVGMPLPKAGVVAVRQGPTLAANLAALATSARLRRFRAQRAWLALIGTGDRCAIAARGRFASAGPMWWHWKEHVDRAFVRRYARARA